MKEKISIYVICFFINSTISFSQNIFLERAVQLDYFTGLNSFIYDSAGGQYILGGNYWDVSTNFLSPTYLTRIDSTGNISWLLNVNPVAGEIADVFSIEYATNNNFIYAGFEAPVCDVFGTLGFVGKVSSAGSMIWSKPFYPPGFSSYYNFGKALAYLSNQTIRVSVDSNVYSLDNLGDSITTHTYHYGKINQIEETPDHYLLFACDSGMLRTDTSGNIISASSFFKKNGNVLVKNSNEYIFNSDKIIYKTDSLFNILNLANLQASVNQIKKIKRDSSLYWVLSESTTGFSEMIKLDDTLAVNSTYSYTSFNGTDFEAKNFIVHQDSYVLAGYEHTQSNSHVFVKSFDKLNNTSFNYQKDVGVISLRADTSYAILIIPSVPIYSVTLDLYATVKNFGNDTITNVHLNVLMNTFLGICLPVAYSENFNNLILLPGDSVEIHVGWISDTPLGFSHQNNHFTLCLWTSSPDEKMDVDHTNDKLCHTFTITNFTGIIELENDFQINVFPNPSASFLEIEVTPYINKKLEVCLRDIYGQNIKTYFLTSPKEKIDISELSNGIYFLQLASEDKIITKKIIKQ